MTFRILSATAALAMAGVVSASCGGGGGSGGGMAAADNADNKTTQNAALEEGAAFLSETEAAAAAEGAANMAELVEAGAAGGGSNMTASLVAGAGTGAKSRQAGSLSHLGAAAKGTGAASETVTATIKYEYDTKLVTIAVVFANGLPSENGGACEEDNGGGKKKSADKPPDNGCDVYLINQNNGNGAGNGHVIFKIYRSDGTIIRGLAKEGRVAVEKHRDGDGEDLDSARGIGQAKARGSYYITGDTATIRFTDTSELFNGSLDDFTTLKIVNRGEKCVFARYEIDLKPAAETMTTATKPGAGPSADSSYNPPLYGPAKAFDGDDRTRWIGSAPESSWNLYYSFPAAQRMDNISVNFYGATYVPATTTLWTSLDGLHWTKTATLQAGSSKPYVAVNKNVAFVWLQMTGKPSSGVPSIREVNWTPVANNFGAYAEPDSDDDWYFPTNAFDNNPSSWWVGKAGAPAWDLYYGYTQPATLNTVTVIYYNDRYAPATTTLYLSSDGFNWTAAGASPLAATVTFTVGATAQYIRVNLRGAPSIGIPLIKDIIVN